jgi:hypothetical protein
MRYRLLILGFACLMALGGCNYEDGPVLSLRSKGARMTFFRPMTYYENNGIDSTAALNQRFEDSIPSFEGRFRFYFQPEVEIQGIRSSDEYSTSTRIGSWEIDGYDDFERIGVYRIPGQTWPPYWWTITRLTHRKLWLEGPGGRLLRFEE